VSVTVLDPVKCWECPSCGRQHVTRTHLVTSEMHHCPAQRGLYVPFVQVESNAGIKKGSMRHVPIERGDFIGKEIGVRHDAEGTAFMAVHTERADGSHDTHVLAPAAQAKIHSGGETDD
jgi:hypothetical protein